MNNGKLNSIMTDLFTTIGKYAPRSQYEEWYRLAMYLRKTTKDCDYVDLLFTICCSDGNLDIKSDCNYSTKQFLYAKAFEQLQWREFTKGEVLKIINGI